MKQFPELEHIQRLAERYAKHGEVLKIETVSFRGESYPIQAFVLGSRDAHAPVFGLVGGVHGLEKIGTHVVLSYMEHLLERLEWDEALKLQLGRVKLVLLPLVNPVGMHRNTRCNGNDVDLMRNSPSRSTTGASFLLGGHRYSRLLPWHMGIEGQMEPEAKALCDFVQAQCESSPYSVVVDVHSGFGLVDQLWFPYAKTTEPFPNLIEVIALKSLLDRVLANHIYRFEPQAVHYTTHGDLWDYVYDQLQAGYLAWPQSGSCFLPLTLELGSWNWIKKNPFQLYYKGGAFNPIKDHRRKRALRRHLPLFDFMLSATAFNAGWMPSTDAERMELKKKALLAWYPHL
jgi:hypothetical protein